MFWGLTPAQDLLDLYIEENKELPSDGEFNILLFGGVDSRHVLKTLSKTFKHQKIKINFYLVESTLETIAKQLLLLHVAFQDLKKFGLLRKVKFFMELFGNTLVRPAVAKFLTAMSHELLQMITDYNYLSQKMPFLSLELRYKERDFLENLLKFWYAKEPFDICDSWDRRLRKYLGARYDSQTGAFDWDLHMRLHTVGAKQICGQEYKNFRLTGTAFNWLESELSMPNRSMVCVVFPNGEKFAHYGYLGEMQTGPFIAYGIKCDDSNYLKSSNGQNAYRSTDVTERNLMEMFHEIYYGTAYEHKTISDVQMGPIIMDMGNKTVVDIKTPESNSCKAETIIEPCVNNNDNFSIRFTSISILDVMKHRPQYQNRFDIVYFGSFHLKCLSKELINNVARNSALIIVENQKYVVNCRDQQLQEFGDEINQKMVDVPATSIPFDPHKDDFAKFIITK